MSTEVQIKAAAKQQGRDSAVYEIPMILKNIKDVADTKLAKGEFVFKTEVDFKIDWEYAGGEFMEGFGMEIKKRLYSYDTAYVIDVECYGFGNKYLFHFINIFIRWK